MQQPPTWRDDPFVQAHPQTAPFWEAAAEGRLLLPRCADCGRSHWYPRPFCPHCHGDALAWVPASGAARVHAASLLRHKTEPYIVAYVELAEGPILLSNLLDCDFAEVSIGQALQVVFRPAPEGRMLPMFTLVR